MMKRTPEDHAAIYLVGAGIASLAAAAFLIRDGDIPGHNITILEESAKLGGSLDAAGTLLRLSFRALPTFAFTASAAQLDFDSQRKNTSGALSGTANGAADFGSGLNFLKTDGFLRKCRSSASTRF